MFYALNWFAVLTLLAFWSGLVWVLHAAATWAVANAGALPAATSGVGGLRLPEWLAPWLPPEVVALWEPVLKSVGPAVEWLVQVLPAVSGVLSFAAWLLWGVVAVLLVVLGVALHLLIAWWRRNGSASVASAAARAGGLRQGA